MGKKKKKLTVDELYEKAKRKKKKIDKEQETFIAIESLIHEKRNVDNDR